MALDVTIHLNHPDWKSVLRPYCKTVRETCAAALEATPLARIDATWSVAVVLADDAFVHQLNRDFRGKDRPTNVLSFPSADNIKGRARKLAAAGDTDLGDVILALETVQREAAAQGKHPRQHAQHLLVHGILHLLGHDHMKPAEAARMEGLEVKILKKQGIANPYL
ncbi:MAG: rRNA maturation RNase YbeY [Proteobacteria bacterium]|nr:rRNA maturation RNase YbeY [Pseudomonadota bacterium]